jgi:hypothetical protein
VPGREAGVPSISDLGLDRVVPVDERVDHLPDDLLVVVGIPSRLEIPNVVHLGDDQPLDQRAGAVVLEFPDEHGL